MLELILSEMVLGVLLNIVASMCVLVWRSALLAQLALRLRTERPFHPGCPAVAHGFGLLILAAIFTVGLIGKDSRPQLLSTFGLVALLVVANWVYHDKWDARPVVGASDGEKATSSSAESPAPFLVQVTHGGRVRLWPRAPFTLHAC